MSEKRIKITKDGPYLVFGEPVIKEEIITQNAEEYSWTYTDGTPIETPKNGGPIALCRCGKTSTPPFCDGKHLAEHFDGTTTAPHELILNEAASYEGPTYTLYDNEAYCAFARFCDAFGQVWRLVQEKSEDAAHLCRHEVAHCPAGRLMLQNNKTGELIEPELPQEIAVLQDPALDSSGPLYVKGGIPVEDENGQTYEVRNRQTLCRCGKSMNKPFCDGTHAGIHYQDGLKKD